MFDWFSNPFRFRKYPTWKDVPDWNKVNNDMNKVTKDTEKVIPFPETAKTSATEMNPPKKEPSVTYYRLGITSDKRVSLQVNYNEIALNSVGIDNLIAQLELFRDHIKSMEEDEE